jgi:hypothetical protein
VTVMLRKPYAVNATPVIIVISSLFVSGCQEDVHSKYATLHELERSSAGARTWFPEVLPTSASNLEVWHDLDTSDTVGRLRFDPAERERLRNRLSAHRLEAPFAQANLPMLEVVDWPQCLRGPVAPAAVRTCGYEAVRVRDFQIVIDPRGSLYFWTP